MWIFGLMIWCTPKMARSVGATHYARIHGVLPGFFNPEDGTWVPRSDLFAPLDWFLGFSWVMGRVLRGQEPDFMFAVGEEIPPAA